jgi:hypothetical protein
VSLNVEHTADTYCEAEGFEHPVHVPAEPIALYHPVLNPDKYCPAGHAALDAMVVFVNGILHTPVTYCRSDGVEHAVHVPPDPTALYAPELNPGTYCPTGHVFVAMTVFVVVPHAAVTYCRPDGVEHAVHVPPDPTALYAPEDLFAA